VGSGHRARSPLRAPERLVKVGVYPIRPVSVSRTAGCSPVSLRKSRWKSASNRLGCISAARTRCSVRLPGLSGRPSASERSNLPLRQLETGLGSMPGPLRSEVRR
jgi:hypothetical protein